MSLTVAGYKLRVKDGATVVQVIDVGLSLSRLITGLTTFVNYGIQIAAYDDTLPVPLQSPWSDLVFKTPTCPSLLVDDAGNFILDDDGNQIIVYV